VSELEAQVRQKFLGRHAENVVWSADDSLFVLWIGINDLAETAESLNSIRTLFQLMNELHDAGARNFLLIDCPPIHRTPESKFLTHLKLLWDWKLNSLHFVAEPDTGPNPDRFEDWNRLLLMQASFFVARHQSSLSLSGDSTTSTPSPAVTPDGVGIQGETSVFVFSSWSTFMSILDYPEAYGFEGRDIDEAEGPIWSVFYEAY